MSEEKKANIQYVGGSKKLPPVSAVNDGMTTIKLPSVEQQLKEPRFYHPKAEIIKKIDRERYKTPESAEQPETDLPNDFPSREVFRGLGKNLADLKDLSVEQLTELPKVGEATAGKVIEYFAKGAK